ncbi:hypothetical protein ACSQN3_000232 [Escherichia coli]
MSGESVSKYQTAKIVVEDAIATYRKKTELVDNLAQSKKILMERISARSDDWVQKLEDANGLITVEADKVALLTASSKAELPVVIERQKSAALEKLEALADLAHKKKEFIIARRELCRVASTDEMKKLITEAVRAVRFVFAFNEVCGRVKNRHELQGIITGACDVDDEYLNAARQYMENKISDGDKSLSLLPRDDIPAILSGIRKYPSVAQLIRAKSDPHYAERLTSGAEDMTGADYD